MIVSTILQIRIRRKINRIFGYIFPISFFTFILSLIIDYYFKVFGDFILDIIFLSCFLLFFSSVIIPYFFNEYVDVGRIKFLKDKIVITVEDTIHEYYIKDLEMVKIFNQGGYTGKITFYSVFDYKGNGNVLEFSHNGNYFKHYFKITSESQYNNWLNIIYEWREINSNVKY